MHAVLADACVPQTVLDALRARKDRFVFDNVEVTLKASVMAFITMNPGYPGRAELPESLKVRCSEGAAHHQPGAFTTADMALTAWPVQALFRPCSMCVPDLSLIAVRHAHQPCSGRLTCMRSASAHAYPPTQRRR